METFALQVLKAFFYITVNDDVVETSKVYISVLDSIAAKRQCRRAIRTNGGYTQIFYEENFGIDTRIGNFANLLAEERRRTGLFIQSRRAVWVIHVCLLHTCGYNEVE